MAFRSRKILIQLILFLALVLVAFNIIPSASAGEWSQIPTVSIATVTGTPVGAIAIVRDNEQGFVNVRSGPSSVYFEIVGVLVEGSQIPALGRSPGGEWIKIAYPGVNGGVAWIWVDLVDIRGNLPIVELPPTPTPRTTATIDPTLAAQFLVEIPPTRMPTFTAPGPVIRPTYTQEPALGAPGRVPMGLILIVMTVVGLLGALISFLGRR
ncbi:MAG: hypothetical protein A2Z16_09980 [Chloroflexi bacterium RBG_16_54_18]|nr:MAG: hypothetical protein A2Z16_09980 [Chloroflexi bacterium RBG_16_54_18]